MAKLTKVEPKDIDFLKELDDGSVVFTKYATIIVPDKYFEKHIAEFIGSSVSIFGLITINVYDTEIDDDDNLDKAPFNEFFFKFKSMILMQPSNIIEIRNKDGEKEWKLIFNKGSAFIKNKNIVVDSAVASKMLDIVMLGYFPNVIPYEEIAKYWTDVNNFNGVGLSAMGQKIIEMIISELCRDPQNQARAFRHKLRDDPKTDKTKYKMINIRLLPKYNSFFSSLTSGDPRGNLISIIGRSRNGEGQRESPVEQAIL